MRGQGEEPGCVAGTSGSILSSAAGARSSMGGVWRNGPPKSNSGRAKPTPANLLPASTKQPPAPISASSASAPIGDGPAGAGVRTKAAARRARRKVLEERYASNTPLPQPASGVLKSAKSAPPPMATTAPENETTLPDPAASVSGSGLVLKKKKTRRSGVKARRRIENAQNREVEAVEAALDELDLHGSDSEEEDVRGYFRTNKCSPVKSKSIAAPPAPLPPASAPPSPPTRSLAPAASTLSPPRATPGLRPLRTPFAARSTALAAASAAASLASTPAPTPLPLRAPAFGSRLTALGLPAPLDNPFASRVGLTPRLPSPSPATAAMFRPSSPAPASPASSLGMKMAWEEGSSYLSNDMSFDISTGASSPTASGLARDRDEDLELDLSADNTRDEILSVDEDHDTTLDEDEVDELSVLGMEGDSLEEMTVSMRVLALGKHGGKKVTDWHAI